VPVNIWTAVFLKELFIGRGLEASLVKGNRKISLRFKSSSVRVLLMQTAPQFKHSRAAQQFHSNNLFKGVINQKGARGKSNLPLNHRILKFPLFFLNVYQI
jgi:hypothetical protein